MPGKEAEVRKGWLRRSLPVVPPQCEWGSWSEQTSLMSQRGQECGCGSPHIAWLSWERRALWEKTSMRMEKGHNRLRGNSSLQNSISESKCGDPHIREIKRESSASSCWCRESKPHPLAHRNVSNARQTEKICLEKNLGGPLTELPHLERTSECPAEGETPKEGHEPQAGKGVCAFRDSWSFSLSTSINIMTETGGDAPYVTTTINNEFP